jgi:chromosome segregation ATPase
MRVGQCDCRDTHLPAIVERIDELEDQVETLEEGLKGAHMKIRELESRLEQALIRVGKTISPFEKFGGGPFGPDGAP